MDADAKPRPVVRDFRQIALWPVHLTQLPQGEQAAEWLARQGGVWREIDDEFPDDPRLFQERHYAEFVAFMPDVQRFLYGEARLRKDGGGYGSSPIRVFRRKDVASAHVQYRPDQAPIDFAVARVELYFFYDIDLAILAVELCGQDLTLDQAEDALFRLSRAYPTNWDDNGEGANCCALISLRDGEGKELVCADYREKERYLSYVCEHRTPRVSAHWQYLMQPLALEDEPCEGEPVRFRSLEHQRIPVFACLAVDDLPGVTREDWMRLGLGAPSGEAGKAPFSPAFLSDFERRYCYDRFWDPNGGHDQIATRILCSGHAFVMVGEAGNTRFTDTGSGITGQFRHQYFLLGMIAHFHRAALLIFRDRLVTAISGLTDYSPETVKRFKRIVRLTHENFLRFTHRYWFQEVSNQAPAHDLFGLWRDHLGTPQLFAEVRQEVLDMIDYLDSDALRRQANTVVRLTVVTFFGLIVSLTVGFIGTGLLRIEGRSVVEKILHVLAVIIPMALIIFYTAKKSHRLAEFLDAISDERNNLAYKTRAFLRIWTRKR